jgi:hypothetical protein
MCHMSIPVGLMRKLIVCVCVCVCVCMRACKREREKFVTRATWQVPLVKHDVYSFGVSKFSSIFSSVLYFVNHCLYFRSFLFLPWSIYSFLLPLWYCMSLIHLQLLITSMIFLKHFSHFVCEWWSYSDIIRC